MPTLLDKWGFLSFYCITQRYTKTRTEKSIIKRNLEKKTNVLPEKLSNFIIHWISQEFFSISALKIHSQWWHNSITFFFQQFFFLFIFAFPLELIAESQIVQWHFVFNHFTLHLASRSTNSQIISRGEDNWNNLLKSLRCARMLIKPKINVKLNKRMKSGHENMHTKNIHTHTC